MHSHSSDIANFTNRSPLAVMSKVLTVTVKPPTKAVEPLITVELSHIINVSVGSYGTFAFEMGRVVQPSIIKR